MIALLLTPMNPCPEDVDKDGVDVDDYNLVANNNGECPIGQFCGYDVNGDCVVDDADADVVAPKRSLEPNTHYCSGRLTDSPFPR